MAIGRRLYLSHKKLWLFLVSILNVNRRCSVFKWKKRQKSNKVRQNDNLVFENGASAEEPNFAKQQQSRILVCLSIDLPPFNAKVGCEKVRAEKLSRLCWSSKVQLLSERTNLQWPATAEAVEGENRRDTKTKLQNILRLTFSEVYSCEEKQPFLLTFPVKRVWVLLSKIKGYEIIFLEIAPKMLARRWKKTFRGEINGKRRRGTKLSNGQDSSLEHHHGHRMESFLCSDSSFPTQRSTDWLIDWSRANSGTADSVRIRLSWKQFFLVTFLDKSNISLQKERLILIERQHWSWQSRDRHLFETVVLNFEGLRLWFWTKEGKGRSG